ncbi:hypothetical protein [Xanthomarina gelatinilytica]|uniref:hypothetical protein n=1 Tax=Xanthomarina gelatinilytica TaxID=1137281 RepID=UPI003AA9B17E
MKRLYKLLPVPIQHLAITFVNNYKYYQKYGAIPFFKPLKSIIKNLKGESVNDDKTLERINGLIEYAVEHVPYYIENKEKYFKLNSIEDLKKIPVLHKETFRKNNTMFISKQVTKNNSYSYKTSGSTGTPLMGYTSIKDLRSRFESFLISLNKEQIDYSSRVGRFLGANVASSKLVYRKDLINNHYLFSIYDLSLENINAYYYALAHNKIEIIEGYPSTIYSLVKLLKTKGYVVTSVKHVLTTAEKLLDHQKEEIEAYFNVNVFDYYGSSEGSAYMYKCNLDYYLNANKVAYFETVDYNFKETENDKPGKMLVTSFTSHFTPLIRYDIGDSCSVISNENQIIKVREILGRQDDVYTTPKGYEFSRFSLLLKYLPENVLESQLVLKNYTDKAELVYVSDASIDLQEFKSFEDKMNTLLKSNFKFKYTKIEGFDKIKRGKLSAIKIIKNED